ncbi:hypothetical protein AMECASPLE_015788 [Ameca splendens]|uniref:Uncharacterized protein n=1 Tax=Ameca splendens TaxID=208324 RepID=A0ABV0YDC9_9TELE
MNPFPHLPEVSLPERPSTPPITCLSTLALPVAPPGTFFINTLSTCQTQFCGLTYLLQMFISLIVTWLPRDCS